MPIACAIKFPEVPLPLRTGRSSNIVREHRFDCVPFDVAGGFLPQDFAAPFWQLGPRPSLAFINCEPAWPGQPRTGHAVDLPESTKMIVSVNIAITLACPDFAWRVMLSPMVGGMLMAEPERWQVSTDAAEVYESCFVPAIFGAWAGPVADAAAITTGNKVLDVGCGTGVLAREALRRVGQKGQVVGLDLNEGMLAVAARAEPKIRWRQGDAASLPFDDASFDVVVSQFALMYFPDRVASLSQMWRTLAPGGRLACGSRR